jgi:hypothetical protein
MKEDGLVVFKTPKGEMLIDEGGFMGDSYLFDHVKSLVVDALSTSNPLNAKSLSKKRFKRARSYILSNSEEDEWDQELALTALEALSAIRGVVRQKIKEGHTVYLDIHEYQYVRIGSRVYCIDTVFVEE